MTARTTFLLLIVLASCGEGDAPALIESQVLEELRRGQQACEQKVVNHLAQRELAQAFEANQDSIIGDIQYYDPSSSPTFFATPIGVSPYLRIESEGSGFSINAGDPKWSATISISKDYERYGLRLHYLQEEVEIQSERTYTLVHLNDEVVPNEIALFPYACLSPDVKFHYKEDFWKNALNEVARKYAVETTVGTTSVAAKPVAGFMEVTVCRDRSCQKLSMEKADWRNALGYLGIPRLYEGRLGGIPRFPWVPPEVHKIETAIAEAERRNR